MKKSAVIVALIAIVAVYSYIPAAVADAIFTPPQFPDLRDLDHHSYYTWGIDQIIDISDVVEARMTFYNIRDWTVEDDDMLFVHLLDDVASGFSAYVDPDPHGVINDYFDGEGLLLYEWSDPAGGGSVGTDLEIVLDATALATLAEYSADGNFGFGLDPDCHYFNDGVEFRLVTEVVPEPSTLALLGFGVGGLGAARYRSRRRKRS